jgi:uncharacterized pyridoxamine 5'-phosphate oxidase family protein
MLKQLIKLVLVVSLGIGLGLSFSMANTKECFKEPYKQNQMVDGCVMQKSGSTWIKTCG